MYHRQIRNDTYLTQLFWRICWAHKSMRITSFHLRVTRKRVPTLHANFNSQIVHKVLLGLTKVVTDAWYLGWKAMNFLTRNRKYPSNKLPRMSCKPEWLKIEQTKAERPKMWTPVPYLWPQECHGFSVSPLFCCMYIYVCFYQLLNEYHHQDLFLI